jgi:hypothetical protein
VSSDDSDVHGIAPAAASRCSRAHRRPRPLVAGPAGARRGLPAPGLLLARGARRRRCMIAKLTLGTLKDARVPPTALPHKALLATGLSSSEPAPPRNLPPSRPPRRSGCRARQPLPRPRSPRHSVQGGRRCARPVLQRQGAACARPGLGCFEEPTSGHIAPGSRGSARTPPTLQQARPTSAGDSIARCTPPVVLHRPAEVGPTIRACAPGRRRRSRRGAARRGASLPAAAERRGPLLHECGHALRLVLPEAAVKQLPLPRQARP